MARQECNRDFGLTFTQEPMVDPVGGLSEGGSGSSVGAPELQREQSLIHLGQIIRRERLAQKITLRNLAERTGMSTAYLVALEKASNPKTGRPSVPSMDKTLSLARELGINASELLELRGELSVRDADQLLVGGKSGKSQRKSPEEFVCGVLDGYIHYLDTLVQPERDRLAAGVASGEFDHKEDELLKISRKISSDSEFFAGKAVEISRIREQLAEIIRPVAERREN